jgi:hypothetical protein
MRRTSPPSNGQICALAGAGVTEAQATRSDVMKMEGASPARLLEMLSDRFGAFEAIAYSTISSRVTCRRTSCRWMFWWRRRCWSSESAFEAIAYSTIKLARHVTEDELSMDLLVAEAVLEFADDLRESARAVNFDRTNDWADEDDDGSG